MSLRKAARAIRSAAGEEARGHAPRPERFRVTRVKPLEMSGVETDVLLHEQDDDVEIHAPVERAALDVGDVVMVQPHPEEDGSGIATWHATHVASTGPGLKLGGVFTLATLPVEGEDFELVVVINAPVGERFKGWDGNAWRNLG